MSADGLVGRCTACGELVAVQARKIRDHRRPDQLGLFTVDDGSTACPGGGERPEFGTLRRRRATDRPKAAT